ncbi:MAG: quinone-dependent dihydroorotate dehydrogenase [Crocinitomicaceae bacterium]|nr:quinone-dependent dihydroorotate dehydrogenase [Crocinitomicaceae bacterium]MCF8410465.1 quinone-dependent dihydroorotate dehydrogenase [Crocinitomicaceae bacterium]MCF8444061.1 quinone-dependent dihydroorotate dehydrogenase [Crocinitomicaceae bacterium]
MYRIIRFFFFFFPPERAHYLAADLLHFSLKIPGLKKLLHHLFVVNNVNLETKVFDVAFKNPVGLAAGFDKNASFYNDFSHLGFGFIEIGTVTPIAQDGNPKPRLFRLKSDDAIINRMGFNNGGVEEVLKNLKKRNTDIVIGGNIGKNKVTSNEDAVLDYIICFNSLYPYVDYFVVNVSSPNTPNLRELQEKEPLTKLLLSLQQENASKEKPKPILLKIAPDLTNQQLDDVIEVVETCKLSGIVATNTTINRSGLSTTNDELQKIGAGGLSGKPLKSRSTEVINYIHTKSEGRFPIIGVGGIHSAEDALEKLDAGASLVQLYTGFIYEGPSLVKKINQAISKRNG